MTTFDTDYLLERMRTEDDIAKPEIVVTVHNGHWVVLCDDPAADHPEFEEKWWPATLYGSSSGYQAAAYEYAKKWAQEVGGKVIDE